jgi:hypothetical protein
MIPRDNKRINGGKGFSVQQITVSTGYCYTSKNLAFPIEPRAIYIRPTLRDGH